MTDKGKYIFCIILILQPILRLYGLPGVGGTFSDYSIIVVALYIFLKKNESVLRIRSTTEAVELLPIMACAVFNVLFTWNFAFDIGNQITYWMRNVLYYFILIYGVKSFYSVEHAYKVYQIMAYASTVFLLVQTAVSSMFGIYIPGQFGPFALADIESRVEDYHIYSYYNLFRPDSFFLEPAHYATFVSGFIMLCSLCEVNIKRIMTMIFCTFGILLSGSTTGLAITVLIWLVWIFRLMKRTNKQRYFFVIMFFGMIALGMVMKTDSFQLMIDRTFNTQDALESRFDWIGTLSILDTPIDWMFGKGNSNDVIQITGWIPGWTIILVSYGIVGVLLYASAYLMMFFHTGIKGKLILLYFVILGIGTEVVADMYVLVVLPFVINSFFVGENDDKSS